ncbi:hypothetical protein C0585_02515 [Candidatus Woesearchaeota archaeon]|nr:MAG: hypothetical protein C0585_02515 [Candidatus Woesearchaeota archaeon]
MKTLVISYLPRRERSRTKKLQDYAVKNLKGEIEYLDLVKELPSFFLEESLSAYYKRNYAKQKLDDHEKKAIEQMDKLTNQFKSADNIVLAYPMYNMSMPGIVKTYFDSILLKGETWDIGEKGYVGLLKEKNAIVITTSAGIYEGDFSNWDHSTNFVNHLFQFMGFKLVDVIHTGGMNGNPDHEKLIMDKSKLKIEESLKELNKTIEITI